jgi:UDP-N-acetylmuramate--alanine ligase
VLLREKVGGGVLEKVGQIHMVGIGGSGMSPLARILLEMGYRVSGSDLKKSDSIRLLTDLGGQIKIGHRSDNINGAELVVASTAICQENVEVAEATKRGIPVIHRSELLALLLNERYGIAVAGVHGKTTTTSMIALILERAGLDPTIVIGGEVGALGGSAKFGRGKHLVAEADESDRSFLRYRPVVAVITTIEPDHLENYDGKFENLIQTFGQFLGNLRENGLAVLGVDNPHVRKLAQSCPRRYVTYALRQNADFQATDIVYQEGNTTYTAWQNGSRLGQVRLAVPGEHNVADSLAAIAVGIEVGLSFREITSHLTEFVGARRRFQLVGLVDDIMIIDDYAHHPTEIKATLHAARTGWQRRIIAAFQPHRYSRTHFLFDEFGPAFSEADEIILTDIYSPPPEKPIVGVTSQRLAQLIEKESKRPVHLVHDVEELVDFAAKIAQQGDLFITMGAGDITKAAGELARRLTEERTSKVI